MPIAWSEAFAVSKEALAAFSTASSCRPEQQGLLVAAVLILLILLLVVGPCCFCLGFLSGAGTCLLALSSGARRAVAAGAAAFVGQPVPLAQAAQPERFRAYLAPAPRRVAE